MQMAKIKNKFRKALVVERHLIGKMVKEEKITESTSVKEGISEEINEEPSSAAAAAERLSMGTSSRDGSSLSEKEQDDQLKSTKAEMGEVREENERLKVVLAQIVNDYESLQMHFLDIAKQAVAKKSKYTAPTHQEDEENELVSLSLGRHASEPKKNEKKTRDLSEDVKQHEIFDEGPKLGLDCRFDPSPTEPIIKASAANSFEAQKEEEPTTETWPPGKSLKTMRSGEDELLQQNHLKRARVSVRARCDTPTMNDGCQWRKYGQKIAKGNPCPRAYYRCTVSPSCPVRKQVQRCAEDMSILITTYEGTHNHPLPMSATAMASTTSAAVSMLQSGSSTSQSGHGASVTNTATSNSANLHGLSFPSSHNSKVPQQFYFPNTSISTLNSHPTVTLDLTAPTTSHNFNRFSSAPRYPSTCLDFSSSTSTSSLDSNISSSILTSWGSSYLSYGTPSYSRSPNQVGYSLSLGRQPSQTQEQFYQAHYKQTNNQNRSQPTLTENTVAAATKAAITSDPTFRSALEAAITSLVSKNRGGGYYH